MTSANDISYRDVSFVCGVGRTVCECYGSRHFFLNVTPTPSQTKAKKRLNSILSQHQDNNVNTPTPVLVNLYKIHTRRLKSAHKEIEFDKKGDLKDQFVLVLYSEKPYPGLVLDADENNVQV